MIDWFVLLTPLLLVPILLLFVFVGCEFTVTGLPPPFGGPGDVAAPGDYFQGAIFFPPPSPFDLGHYEKRRVTLAAFYRPSDSSWHIFNEDIFTFESDPSTTPDIRTFSFGSRGDIAVPGNYHDADPNAQVGDPGGTQPAVFRPSSGTWHIGDTTGKETSSFPLRNVTVLPGDIPLPPGNYLGDANNTVRAVALFRPSTGEWFISDLQGNVQHTFTFAPLAGQAFDIPVPGDYDGNGITQPAVFTPSKGVWSVFDNQGTVVRRFTINQTLVPLTMEDIPLPPRRYLLGGAGVPRSLALYRPSMGTYQFLDLGGFPITSIPIISPGQNSDQPAPGQYHDLGQDDAVVFRPSDGTWHLPDFITRA